MQDRPWVSDDAFSVDWITVHRVCKDFKHLSNICDFLLENKYIIVMHVNLCSAY